MRHDETWVLLLLAYTEGALTAGRQRQVEAHLRLCNQCREAVAMVERGQRALQEEPFRANKLGPETEAFLAAVERRAERAWAPYSAPPPRGRTPTGWRSRFTAAAASLTEGGQAVPLTWFLLSLPAFVAVQSPGAIAVGAAVVSLSLGFILEYLWTEEVVIHDSH